MRKGLVKGVRRSFLKATAVALALVMPLTAAPLRKRDRRYLSALYRDTWSCLAHFVSPKTGLPYDSSRRPPATSLTNIGFYLAACAVAGRTGLIRPEQANARLEAALASLEKVPRFLGGFPVTWVDVDALTSTEDRFSTVDHLSHLTAGLLVVKGIVPALAERIDQLLTPMDWGDLYDPTCGWYRGGWRLSKKDFDVQQKGWRWYYTDLGSDARFGYLWGIGTGQIPPESWTALKRDPEVKDGFSYLRPGWRGGGLFQQGVTGLFVDERATVLGKSMADFAWAQMHHAVQRGSPVWGWSASESPDGKTVLEWDGLRDEVVAPYAAGLAVVYYPRQVVNNFRRLQKRGVRKPWREKSRSYAFGFRDSLEWKTGVVSEVYGCADQGMLFLSLANALHDGVLWKAVAVNPHLRRALRELSDYTTVDDRWFLLYEERDGRKGAILLPPLKPVQKNEKKRAAWRLTNSI